VNKYHQWFANGIPMGVGPSTSFHIYLPGEHSITHIILDSLHNCFDSTIHTINVNFGNHCFISFYANNNDSAILGSSTLYANPTVYGGGAVTNYIWSVNGKVVDSANNPTYTLAQPGINYTCLTITTDSGCAVQYCHSSEVFTKCDIPVSIDYTVDSLIPATVTFRPQPHMSKLFYQWKINNIEYGYTTETLQNYYPGTYPVSLYVLDTARWCFDSTAGSFIIPSSACDTFSLSFKYNYAPGDSSLMYFNEQSNQPLSTQSWLIRSLYDSTTYVNLPIANPSYNFSDTGHYAVCVTAQSAVGCGNTYCDIVYAGNKHGKPAANNVTSYPNPATSHDVSLTVPFTTADKIIVNVYNQGGTKVYITQKQGVSGNNQLKIPVWQLKPGQYFIEIICGKERKRSVFQKL